MTAKKWILTYLLTTFIPLLCISPLVPFVDPYMHYHKPLLEKFFYTLSINVMFQVNNGITRNFDYDAFITGTSMAADFRTSEFDRLFGCHSVKVPFYGGSYFEINNNQKVAFKNHKVKYMIRSLDPHYINAKKDFIPADHGHPSYFDNEFLLDDVNYLWSKDAILQSVRMILDGAKGKNGITTFDEYAKYYHPGSTGRQNVLGNRTRFKQPKRITTLKDERSNQIKANLRQNVIQLALEHPECEFYYFFPPYSIVEWGRNYEKGSLNRKLQEEELAINLILQCDNIHLFSFNTKYEWILNLDNYIDHEHYGEWINSEMLHLMKADECRITKENVVQYLQEEREFYTNFDYNSIFQ